MLLFLTGDFRLHILIQQISYTTHNGDNNVPCLLSSDSEYLNQKVQNGSKHTSDDSSQCCYSFGCQAFQGIRKSLQLVLQPVFDRLAALQEQFVYVTFWSCSCGAARRSISVSLSESYKKNWQSFCCLSLILYK